MMKSKLWYSALAVGLIQPVWASDTNPLPVLVVTATGAEQSGNDIPVSTLAISQQDLFAQGSKNLGEALRGEAGVSVGNDSAQGQNPYIRGLGKERIVVLMDGMRLNSGQPAGSVTSMMTLVMAEQLEVVKGGASTLYGTGALGGVVNVRLPQARFDELSARANAGAAMADDRRYASAVVNAGNQQHALMLGGSKLKTSDYDAPDGTVDNTGYQSGALIGQYRFRINDWQLRLSYQNQADEDLWYPGSSKPHQSNPKTRTQTIRSPEQTRTLTELGMTYATDSQRLDVRAYRQEMKRTIYLWGDWLNDDIMTNDVSFETDGADIRYDHFLSATHTLSAGVNYWELKASPRRMIAQPPTFTQFVNNNPTDDASLDALGYYLQDEWLHDDWTLLTAIRRDRVKADAAAMNNGSQTTGLAHSDTATTGSIAAMYRISDRLRPYARISRAFRAADLRERYESGLRGDGYFYIGSPEVSPEKADQIEIGIKGQDQTLTYQVSAHHQRVNDYISGEIQDHTAVKACGKATFCKKTVNIEHVTLKGMDASLNWQLLEQHQLGAQLSVIRGENNDLEEPLYQMPADEITLSWSSQWNDQWRTDVELRAVDQQDRIATEFSRGLEDETSGFTTLAAGVSWMPHPEHQVRLRGSNLTNRGYHEHQTEGLSGQEIQAPGRNLELSWQGKF